MPNGINDPYTHMNVGMTSDHHYIHIGKGYSLAGTTGSIAASGVEHISFKTPIAEEAMIHFRPARVSSRANSLSVTMTEGAVMTSGTLAVPRNKNRNKVDKSKVVAYTGATLTTAGTGGIVYLEEVGTGGVSNRGGGSGGADEEIVLKPDTTYSITFTNTGASTATFGTYMLFWYEE